MKFRQNLHLSQSRTFGTPDDSLEESVWSWLPEPRCSPSSYHHSFWHQLTDLLIFYFFFIPWGILISLENIIWTLWRPILLSSFPQTPDVCWLRFKITIVTPQNVFWNCTLPLCNSKMGKVLPSLCYSEAQKIAGRGKEGRLNIERMINQSRTCSFICPLFLVYKLLVHNFLLFVFWPNIERMISQGW